MSNADAGARPIIIKRKKVAGGDGHHGGAWKVAYADFVTAMMAFFLLMWLLNATTESQRKGIADYFAPTVPVFPVSGGGDGVLQGDSVFSNDTLAAKGTGGSAEVRTRENGDKMSARDGRDQDPMAKSEDEPLETIEEIFLGRTGESDASDDLLSHIVTRVTDEGLVIEVFSREGRPLFETGSSEPTPRMRSILAMIADVVGIVKNKIAIDGHTDATPYRDEVGGNWGLSADRADAARAVLAASGMDPDRFSRITGHAAREPALPDAPLDPRNRRVTITLLRTGS